MRDEHLMGWWVAHGGPSLAINGAKKGEIWGKIGGKPNMRATCDDGGVKDVTHGCFFSKRWVGRREFWLK